MINPRYLYIHPKESAGELLMRRASITHSIDLPNGLVLTSAEFHFEDSKDRFEQFDQVQPVAHDGEPISNEHAQMLTHLKITVGDSAKIIRKKLKVVHPLM